ncbi:hypothetical protein BH23ACT10_BH23ACT10_21900 [soil metagenome]
MASVSRMITGLADYTLTDLEALENERPELGRLEVIDGALHATGESAVGNLHQLVMQRLHLLFASLCPPDFIVRIGTWWMSPRGKLRPDVAVYRGGDEPADCFGAFQVTPYAILEILSDDADHDLVRKDGIYEQFGVSHRGYIDMRDRYPWWCRLDGSDHATLAATWQLGDWPDLVVRREELFAT